MTAVFGKLWDPLCLLIGMLEQWLWVVTLHDEQLLEDGNSFTADDAKFIYDCIPSVLESLLPCFELSPPIKMVVGHAIGEIAGSLPAEVADVLGSRHDLRRDLGRTLSHVLESSPEFEVQEEVLEALEAVGEALDSRRWYR